MHKGQLVLQCDLLAAHQLLVARFGEGPSIDARVGHHHHAAHAADLANARQLRATGHAPRQVRVVHAVTGQRGQRQKRSAEVEQLRQALTRQQSATFGKTLGRFGRGITGALLQRMPGVDQFEHALSLRGKGVRRGVNAGLKSCHVVWKKCQHPMWAKHGLLQRSSWPEASVSGQAVHNVHMVLSLMCDP